MKLKFKNTDNGIKLSINNRILSLTYPNGLWKKYPKQIKEALFDNIAHCNTIALPLVTGIKKLEYNTAFPILKSFFDDLIINEIPSSVDGYSWQNAKNEIEKFIQTDYIFEDYKAKNPKYPSKKTDLKDRIIIPFSCGKDSLLTLGLAKELGLNPVCVYINDTVSPTENRIKINFSEKLANENNTKIINVKNQLEQANDFEFWGKKETCLSYSHMMMGFNLISLPIAHHYNANAIVTGNQQNMNFTFKTDDGITTYPSYSQTSIGTKKIDSALKLFTDNSVKHYSLIEPITNLVITRILHKRYPHLGKYQISCASLDASYEKRWCHDCTDCARLTIAKLAMGINPKTVGMKSKMLSKDYKHCYGLFNSSTKEMYEVSSGVLEQQMFSFYLAYKNGHKGYLIDLFRKNFLDQAVSKEDEFRKKFFRIYPSKTIPSHLKKPLFSIYKEEIGAL